MEMGSHEDFQNYLRLDVWWEPNWHPHDFQEEKSIDSLSLLGKCIIY